MPGVGKSCAVVFSEAYHCVIFLWCYFRTIHNEVIVNETLAQPSSMAAITVAVNR